MAGQYAALDEMLTGRENLGMIGRLYRSDATTVDEAHGELLERFELTDAADRTVKTYSGGMRRRLDLAAALMSRAAGDLPRRADHRPRPEGAPLDVGPHRTARAGRHDGAHDDAVPRGGRSARRRHPRHRPREGDRARHGAELKQQVGGERLEVVIDNPIYLPRRSRALEAISEATARVDEPRRGTSAFPSPPTRAS